jgi:hypothetical protein
MLASEPATVKIGGKPVAEFTNDRELTALSPMLEYSIIKFPDASFIPVPGNVNE